MKKLSRILALVLALTMVAALFVGCNSAGTDASDATGGSANQGGKTVLTVEMFDRGFPFKNGDTTTNNEATRYLQKNFGDPNNIELEFVAVPRNEEVSKLNLLMAGKTAPDVCFTYDMDVFYSYATKGGLTDLKPYLAKCPTLSKQLEGLYYCDVDGKMFGVNNGRKNVDTWSYDQGQFMNYIRKDWLDKLNLQVPKTADELFEVLKAFRDADPKLLGTDRVIPWGMSAWNFQDEDWQQMTLNCTDSFTKPMSDEDFATLPYLKRPGFKDGVAFLNKCFNEGLIDPDFALQNDKKTFFQQISNGNTGFWMIDTGLECQEGQQIATLLDTHPEAEVLPINCFTNAEGKNPHRCYTGADIYVFVPSFSKNAEAAMMYMEFVVNNQKFLSSGVEGVNYVVKDGIKVTKDMEPVNWTPWDFMPRGGFPVESLEAAMNASKFNVRPELNDIIVEGSKLARQDTWHPFEFGRPLEMSTKYTTTLDKKFQDTMVKTISCKPAEFSALYDKLVGEYMDMGGQEVLDEKVEVYRDIMKDRK